MFCISTFCSTTNYTRGSIIWRGTGPNYLDGKCSELLLDYLNRKYKKEAPIATSGLSQASNLFLHGFPTNGDTSSYLKKNSSLLIIIDRRRSWRSFFITKRGWRDKHFSIFNILWNGGDFSPLVTVIEGNCPRTSFSQPDICNIFSQNLSSIIFRHEAEPAVITELR